MKFVRIAGGVVFTAALMLTCLLTVMEVMIYKLPGFWPGEYEKYGIYDIVKVTPDDLKVVTDEMMAYLKGDRELLSDIETTIDGQEHVLYFNEKECLHMADCRVLFVGAFRIRRICLIVMAVILACAVFGRMFRELVRTVLISLGVLSALIGAAAVWISKEFYTFFVLFHHTFFDNDLWLLDPDKDRLLMLMPQEFFEDCVRYIGIGFACSIVLCAAAAAIYLAVSGRTAGRQK